MCSSLPAVLIAVGCSESARRDFIVDVGRYGVVVGYPHVIMETKGGNKSKKSSIQYESPLGYVIEDVRPHGGSEKFRTAAYSNVSVNPIL